MHPFHKEDGLVFHRSDESTKHPLNIILKLLFGMFKARYVVRNYEKTLRKREAEKKREEELRKKALLAAQLVKSNGFDDDDDDFRMSEVPESPIRLPFRAVQRTSDRAAS